jgi:hypothetical protein
VPAAAVPWDLYGLKIAETQSALQPIVLFLRTVSRAQRRKLGGRLLIFGGSRPKRIPTLPSPCEEEATCARTRIHSLDDEPTIEPHESPRGRGNRHCFFTRFVVKRHPYGAKGIGAFYGHPPELERARRDFSFARGVFRSPQRPESESPSRERRDAGRARAGESERPNAWNNWSATTGQNR